MRTGGRSFVLLWLMVFSLNMSAAVKYDWVIRNGWVFIGDGSSAQIRDIGLKDGVIYTLGNSERVDSDHTIDACIFRAEPWRGDRAQQGATTTTRGPAGSRQGRGQRPRGPRYCVLDSPRRAIQSISRWIRCANSGVDQSSPAQPVSTWAMMRRGPRPDSWRLTT